MALKRPYSSVFFGVGKLDKIIMNFGAKRDKGEQ
jgi:hypothetical protein